MSHRRVDLLFRSDQTGLVSVRTHPTTNNSGKWSIKNVGHHGGSGRYIAKIHKITFKHTNRHTHSCKKAAAGVDFP